MIAKLNNVESVALATSLDSPRTQPDMDSNTYTPEKLKDTALSTTELCFEGVDDDYVVEKCRANQCSLGNGNLSYAPTANGARSATYARGLFAQHYPQCPVGMLDEDRAKLEKIPASLCLPDFWALNLNTGSDAYMDESTLSRSFDMEHNIMKFSGTMLDTMGNKTDIEIIQFLSLDNPNVAVMKVKLTPRFKGNMTIMAGVDGMPTEPGTGHYKDTVLRSIDNDQLVLYETETTENQKVALAQRAVLFDEHLEAAVADPVTVVDENDRRVWQSFTVHNEVPGETYELVVTTSVHTDVDQEILKGAQYSPVDAAVLEATAAPGYGELLDRQTGSWDRLLSESSLEIVGDDELAKALLFNRIHTLAEVAAKYEFAGPGAKYSQNSSEFEPGIDIEGVTIKYLDEGQGYNGHYFWDGDIFVSPALTPEQRKALLNYRYNQLDAARKKAKDAGYNGAWYAWEATLPDYGEACPPRNYNSSGALVEIAMAEQSVHISADVAYAAMKYYRETDDEEFLRDKGAEIVIEAARFLMSRATVDENGKYIYEHVTGPDEYHEDVTNNAYTVLMAAHTMQLAKELFENNKVSDDLKQKLGIAQEELNYWERVRQNLYEPFDPNTLVFKAFDGWEDLEHIDLQRDYPGVTIMDAALQRDRIPEDVRNDPQALAALSHDAKNPVCKTDVIKQHDTVLALVLLGEQVLDFLPEDTVSGLLGSYDSSRDKLMKAIYKANFEKYAPQTSDGSSLSPSTRVLAALAAGENPDDHYVDFRNLAQMDTGHNTHHTEDGLHSANMGASIWVATEGFMGIKATGESLNVSPRMPSAWRSAERVIGYKGQKVRVNIDNRGFVFIELLEPSEGASVPVAIKGYKYTLTPEARIATYRDKSADIGSKALEGAMAVV